MADTETECINCGKKVCVCVPCTSCNSKVPTEDFCTTCNSCTFHGCCSCWSCAACQRNYTNTTVSCRNCNSCPNCCHCTECPRCHNITNGTRLCDSCHNCRNCCRCGAGFEWIQAKPQPTFHYASKYEHKTNPSNRALAVEIEVASVKRQADHLVSKVVRTWEGAIVRDGSLPESGFEINTAPASGDKFIEQIQEITQALKNQNATVNDKCGLHVHVDARNFNWFDIRKLILLYAKIENTLFEMVSKDRKGSRFCLPCSSKYVKDLDNINSLKESRNKVLKNVYGFDVDRLSNVRVDKYSASRYNALNIHSYLYRGTIESRMFHGSKDFDEIVNWSLMWAGFLDYTHTNTEKEIKLLAGSGIDIIGETCLTDTVKKWTVEQHNKFKNGKMAFGSDVF